MPMEDISPAQLQALYPLCVDRKKKIVAKGRIVGSEGNEISQKCLLNMVIKCYVKAPDLVASEYFITRTGVRAVLSCYKSALYRKLEREHGMIPYGW